MNQTGTIILTATILVAAGLAVTVLGCGYSPSTLAGVLLAVAVLVSGSVVAWFGLERR